MKQTTTSTFAVCLLAAVALAACDRRDGDTDAAAAADAAATPAGAGDAATASDAGESATAAGTDDPSANGDAASADDSTALGLLGAVNQHEIAAGEQAKSKKVSAPVMDYADMMIKEHGDNQAKTESLGTLADNADVRAQKEKGKSELDMLAAKNGEEYEKAYVDAMVKGHTEALALIDGKLMSLASSEPVKQHLTDTRKHVAAHLEAAKKLQGG